MDAQNSLNQPVVPASTSRRRGETDEQNQNDLKTILANGESASAGDFISHAKLTKRQNIILSSIGLLVVIAIGLAVWQMGRTLKLPLPTTGKEKAVVAQKPDNLDLAQKSPDELKKLDTDGDKINDFEELYVYDTSPYLADSDSDGIDDFDEIVSHTDPTCPEGQSCFQSGSTASTAGAANVGEGNSSVGANVSLTKVSTADLRKLLIQSGKVTAEQAAAIDDATLLEIYGQALEQNPDLANQLPATQPASPLTAIEDKAATPTEALNSLNQLSAAEVRKMLLEQGFAEAELKLISDEELLALYQDALDQASQNVKE